MTMAIPDRIANGPIYLAGPGNLAARVIRTDTTMRAIIANRMSPKSRSQPIELIAPLVSSMSAYIHEVVDIECLRTGLRVTTTIDIVVVIASVVSPVGDALVVAVAIGVVAGAVAAATVGFQVARARVVLVVTVAAGGELVTGQASGVFLPLKQGPALPCRVR